jgi:hypothetical protein
MNIPGRMALPEKLSLLDKDTLLLHKEGVFRIAYGQDACRLCGIKRSEKQAENLQVRCVSS